MRNLVYATNWPVMAAGTITLAVTANTYEFLCTSGFPMIFTRVLTLQKLSTGAYYFYLMFYNFIYVIPLFLIVVAFTVTLGVRKLTEEQGRILKLLSGLMMASLGNVLLFVPQWLDRLSTSALLLAGTVCATVLIVILDRLIRK